ncbi:MAG TPA: radical SAM protein, partial [Candidatus Wirthbacteria bacterium]|nr:radical SAM protein [Candidatus Wirthbacteria bacterium]
MFCRVSSNSAKIWTLQRLWFSKTIAELFYMSNTPKKVFLLTLGCPKNEVDSEFLLRDLIQNGFASVIEPEQATHIIVNTCGFLASALKEAKETMEDLYKQKQPHQQIFAVGCAVKRVGPQLVDPNTKLDGFFATWQELLGSFTNPASKTKAKPSLPSTRLMTGLPYAYLTIAYGCDENCHFCTIPSIKGPFVSRPASEISQEVHDLLALGYQEIILIAQNTTAYGLDWKKQGNNTNCNSLAKLLDLICQNFPQLPWLRIMYAYPDYITQDLIDTMASYPNICHYLDIPQQHVVPAVLKNMGR